MNTVPIVFAFDGNLVKQACVCMTSLLENAKADTFYDIFVLYACDLNQVREYVEKIPRNYANCKVRYIEVDDDVFRSAFEIRGVTIATYYRLLLSKFVTEYDKVIYSDVDIIYRMDLSDVYREELGDNYIAATLDLGMNYLDRDYVSKSMRLQLGRYIQAGFVVFNLKKIREDNLTDLFVRHVEKHKYIYQDQDILNICCMGRIKYLSPCYNVNDCSFIVFRSPNILEGRFSLADCEYARTSGNVHYSGKKPWQQNCFLMDLWWEYYRKSPIYDIDVHFDHFFKLSLYLDSLTLWERIKNLGRFFIYGRKCI